MSRNTFVYARPHAPRINHTDGFHRPIVKAQIPLAHKPTVAHESQTETSGWRRTSQATKERPDLPRQARSNVLTRHAVRTTSKKFRPKKYRKPLLPVVMTAMAVMLFGFGLFAVFSSLRTDKAVKAQVQGLAKASDEEGMTDGLPSEDNPPQDISGYTVAPNLPRFLKIEKLDLFARIRPLGVAANNVLKAPANVYDVGWYNASAKPGENGTIVLDGHVSGPTQRGVFYGIGSLKEGDKIKVERGDGTVFTYSVTSTETYDSDKVDMAKIMTSSVPGRPALNLITCAGRFNVRTNQFEQRVAVFTVQDI